MTAVPHDPVPLDPVALTAALIRCRSVTPEDGGALGLLQGVLEAAGFACTRVDRGGICNLFARWGARGAPRSFGFNGHTDVVPVGDASAWTHDPFGAEVAGGRMFGRGAVDMKSGVAAFVAAAVDFVTLTPPDGAVIVTVTGDEEGEALHGTVALLDWMRDAGEAMSVCLVGEPTCPDVMGEAMKIGRRGSLTAHLTATGVQGHSAYPDRAKNPLTALVRLLDRLASAELDRGTRHFDASTLAIVTVDTGNPATNVIPASAWATVNIRFNDRHSGASLTLWLKGEAAKAETETGVGVALRISVSGEAFLTPPGPLSALVSAAVTDVTGLVPGLSTTGGTSDARFVKDHCPVVEFGLVGRGMHMVDEAVDLSQIMALKAVYARVLERYFA